MVGEVIDGRYRVIERLGAGGVGKVYRAERLKVGRAVAIKFLRRSYVGDQGFVRRFEREALAMSRLYHRHCVALIDFGVHQGIPYLVMEYLAGQTLSSLLQSGPLDPRRAIAIMKQLLETLDYFHGRNVVHRDLKAENVMLIADDTGGETVKLLDFGMAKLLAGAGANVEVTAKGNVVGTPSSMSPEQIREMPIDGRTDIYSAGILLHQMLVGRKPFVHSDDLQVLKMHLNQEPARVRDLLGKRALSAELDDVVFKSLAKDREQRYQSAGQTWDALSATPEWHRAAAERRGDAPKRPRKRRWLGFWGGLGWVAFVLLAAFWLVSHWKSERRLAGDDRAMAPSHTAPEPPGSSPDKAPRRKDGDSARSSATGAVSAQEPTPPAGGGETEPSAPGSSHGDGGQPPQTQSDSLAAASLGGDTERDIPVPGGANEPTAAAQESSVADGGPGRPTGAVSLVAAGDYAAAMEAVKAAIRADPAARSDPEIISAAIGALALPRGDRYVPLLVRSFADVPEAVDALSRAVTGGENWYVRHHALIVLSKMGYYSRADRVGMWLADLEQSSTCQGLRRSFRRLLSADDSRAKAEVTRWRKRAASGVEDSRLRCVAPDLQ